MRPFWCGLALALAHVAFGSSPADVLVMLDESGSMYGNPRRGTPAQDEGFMRHLAIQCLARKLRPDDRIAVVPFGSAALRDRVVVWSAPFDARAVDYSPLADVARSGRERQYGTNYADALRVSRGVFGRGDPSRVRVAILLSDGVPNSPGNSSAELVAEAQRLKASSGARLYAIGLGPAARFETLEMLAQCAGGRSFAAHTAEEVPFLFAEILREAAEREVRTPRAKASFTVGPGARELHAVAIGAGAQAPFALIQPDGSRLEPTTDPAIVPSGQRGQVSWLRVESPRPGKWALVGDPKSVDIGYESSLKALLVSPREGTVVTNEGELRVVANSEGAASDDEVRGMAVLTLGDGAQRSAPMAFRGSEGAATLGMEGTPAGEARVQVRIWRTYGGEREEGVPDASNISIIQAPPGVPTVMLTWPKASEIRVGWGGRASFVLRLTSTKEAAGSILSLVPGSGWRTPSGSSVKLGPGVRTLAVSLDGPYRGRRGSFTTDVRAVSSNPALQIVNDRKRFTVLASNWLDWVLLSLPLAVLIVAAVALLLIAMLVGGWHLGQKKSLRRRVLDSIELRVGGCNVVAWRPSATSVRERSFGDEHQDGQLDLTPPVAGKLLNATLMRKGGKPNEILFAANGLRCPTQPGARNSVRVLSATPTTLELAGPDGQNRQFEAYFLYDTRLARRVELGLRTCQVLTVVLVLTTALLVYHWVSLAGKDSYEVEFPSDGPGQTRSFRALPHSGGAPAIHLEAPDHGNSTG